MPYDNSLNTGKGRDFQEVASRLLGSHYGVTFELDCPMPIGSPPKQHRFDLVSTDRRFVGECKNYSWTETGNVPSAKMGFVNEAVFYLSHLSTDARRFIVLRLDSHTRRKESLADYYFRTYRHLLNGIVIVELDPASGVIRELT